MKTYPRARRRRPPNHIRVRAFLPVPLRARADGWTPARQAAFLGALAETRSVSQAARRVGMARETAYRLRRRPEAASFAAAWDAALGRVTQDRPKVTAEERRLRALYGLLKPMIYRGRHVGTIEKADNSALLAHLAQLARSERAADAAREKSRGFGGRSASTESSPNGEQ
jgi:molybdenum-dependent DNA-binding transcriptional regulator ModE